MSDLCDLTKRIWYSYVLGEEDEELKDMEDIYVPDCVIIGTGKHEIYTGLAQFKTALQQEMAERQAVRFQLKDFWCEERKITPETSFVFGGIYIWWESDDKKIYINMESRFSILYKKENDRWKIVHIHQSMPNLEQAEGEYYPKTMAEQIKESYEDLERFKVLAERDSLTELINYRTFSECYANWKFDKTWLFVLDIDKFKQINDKYGHLTGNQVLQKMARLLEYTVRASDLVCRMGGDEFLVLTNGFVSEEKAQDFVKRIQRQAAEEMKDTVSWSGISVGMTRVSEGESLDMVIERADRKLYEVKSSHNT